MSTWEEKGHGSGPRSVRRRRSAGGPARFSVPRRSGRSALCKRAQLGSAIEVLYSQAPYVSFIGEDSP